MILFSNSFYAFSCVLMSTSLQKMTLCTNFNEFKLIRLHNQTAFIEKRHLAPLCRCNIIISLSDRPTPHVRVVPFPSLARSGSYTSSTIATYRAFPAGFSKPAGKARETAIDFINRKHSNMHWLTFKVDRRACNHP